MSCDFTERKQCEEYQCGNQGSCKIWAKMESTTKHTGMTMEEMLAHHEEANANRTLGVGMDWIMQRQQAKK